MQQTEMLQAGSQMSLFLTLGFAWLLCDFTTGEAASGSNAGSAHVCHRTSHKGLHYDTREAIHCGDHIHHGSGLSCCGKHAYNPENATCCQGVITEGFSEKVSRCCGSKPYNPLNDICCNSAINAKSSPTTRCCGKGIYDAQNQLCCGPDDNKVPLTRNTSDSQCCLHKQYNPKTECCCWENRTTEVKPRNKLMACPDDSCVSIVRSNTNGSRKQLGENNLSSVKVELQSPPNCTHPNTTVCGTSCYDPNEQRCCERRRTRHDLCSPSGQRDPAPTVYNPHSQICCDGRVFEWKPWLDQCCGDTPYGSAQRGVLCCNNTLYLDREDGEECSDISVPYNPAKGTVCCSQLHGSPGKHCCGTGVYDPHSEICCDGHRHNKANNSHCCGIHAYDVKDPQMKCCAGTLYNLTAEDDKQCCGSILHNPQHQDCCRSEGQEVLYSAKEGFKCCGHLHYNTTLWSCCAERLRQTSNQTNQQTNNTNGPRLLSVINEKANHLCNKTYIVGTVESVSLESVVFNNVLKIKGTKTEALPLHIMKIGDRCSFPRLIRGKSYFFNKDKVFTNVNHDSVFQTLHYIVSKCSS